MRNHLFLILFTIISTNCVQIKKVSQDEKNSEFWIENGKSRLQLKINQTPITTKAKNIILFIGDGMGISTITATRIYKNQRSSSGKSGDENLAFEDLPNAGLCKTYSVDDYVGDSASTATAILSGIKTNKKMLGISPRLNMTNCQLYKPNKDDLKNIADYFYLQNKSLGIVTTAAITGATPAAVYAKTISRYWKYKTSKQCPFKDIATQLITKAKMFQVIFGGGRSSFLAKVDKDPEYEDVKGSRKDKNLINDWKTMMKGKKANYIWNHEQLNAIIPQNVDYVFGLFEPHDMQYVDENGDDPSLQKMTIKAIEILSKNENGFFLLVEEGKIDKAHHGNQAYRAIIQTLELEKALKAALEMIDPNETLVIVTADHSHVMTLGGYSSRENDITGSLQKLAKDRRGYTSLLYSNGPNFQSPRENITNSTIFTPRSRYNAGVPLKQETHGGEEVAVYSLGPWAHLLRDVNDQSLIGHVMMYSSCSGVYHNRIGCLNRSRAAKNMIRSRAVGLLNSVILILLCSFVATL